MERALLMQLDRRGKKIVLAAHCIVNQSSRVQGLVQHLAVLKQVVNLLQKQCVGVIQMACPELTYASVSRGPHTREEYGTPNIESILGKSPHQ